jgi:hypothetical protein
VNATLLAALGGGAQGASRGLGSLIDILNHAADEKKADSRYQEEKNFRQSELDYRKSHDQADLDARLATSGYLPSDAPPVAAPNSATDKALAASGRPPLSAILDKAAGAPTSDLFSGVRPSMGAPGAFAIDQPASLGLSDPSSVAPNGVAALAPSTDPVRSSLDQASKSVAIGGKQYTMNEENTPAARRERAIEQRQQQVDAAKSAERKSNLIALRRSNPTKYADLTDDLINAASSDDYVYHQIVMPREDPIAVHAAERSYDVNHPLKSEALATPEKRAAYVLKRAALLQKPTKGSYGRVVPGMDRATAEATAGEEYDNVTGAAPSDGSEPPARSGKNGKSGDIVLPPNPTAKPALSPADAARAASDPGFKAWLVKKGML